MDSNTNFTHIVVGAGSAGCIIAARIAENDDFNVLLLEAGPDCEGPDGPRGAQDIRRVPMKDQSEIFDDGVDWKVRVELPEGGAMTIPQAKLVGGGSSINGGTALRNAVDDCREWVELGNDAWAWDCVEPVYGWLESDKIKETKGPHPLARTKIEEAGKIQKAFIAGAIDSGLSWTEDLNALDPSGVGASPVCREGTRRISAANTFIDPIRGKSNFHLLTYAAVDRVLFSGRNATGVILADQRQFTASAEVILSAGAIFSPAVLQRSGIGPASLLSSLSIPVLKDLPVGANLADHPTIPVVARPKPGAYIEGDYSLQMQARWSSTLHPNSVDLQLVCFSYLYSTTPSSQTSQPVEVQRSLGGTASGHVAGIGCNVNKPTSVGSLRIRSGDPQKPLVIPNYFTNSSDLACARQAVRLAHRIIHSQAMQAVLSAPLGLTPDILASDRLLNDWILSQYSSAYHFSSTCRMAWREQGGVVDQSGCVYGVHGLRVADASVIPTIPAANTMWTAMMFAERIGRSLRDGRSVISSKDKRAKL